MQRSTYLSLRHKFEPQDVKLVIVAELPPASGKYFYDPAGAIIEPLFSALMQQLDYAPASKENGLREFQARGWLLIDATYEPVNSLSDKAADAILLRDYPLLRDDLLSLTPDRSAPLVLLKANVCRLLEPLLTHDGFNVLNKARLVYFPTARPGHDGP